MSILIIDDRKQIRARFWSKVENSSGASCWQWLGATNSDEYGTFFIQRNGNWILVLAHRTAWELCRGPIPPGMCVLHKCDNRGCVNPDHLFLGTHRKNMEDMVVKGRSAKGEKHGSAKLTLRDIPLILLGSVTGQSQRVLAKRYGVGSTAIANILNGKRWRKRFGGKLRSNTNTTEDPAWAYEDPEGAISHPPL